MNFDRVIVIGTKQLALECIKAVYSITSKVEAIIHIDNFDFSYSKEYLEKNNIIFNFIYDKDELDNFFLSIVEDCLIISANNVYLFSDKIVNKPNLDIINFHDALLPKHRGIHAPSWAIFQEDEYSGITWHKVTKEIDCGPIIIQSKIPIDNSTTAYTLTKETIKAGIYSFGEIINDLLDKKLDGWEQPKGKQDHYSWETPNNSKINITDHYKLISAFLRSTDYKGLKKFCNRKLRIESIDNEIISYDICKNYLIIKYSEGNKINCIKLSTPKQFN